MTKQKTKLGGEYVALLQRIRDNSGFQKFKCVLGVGRNSDLLAESAAEDLRLRLIGEDDAILYRVEEILVIFTTKNLKWRKYKQHGYTTYNFST